jgi:hypothetical protein
METIAWCSAHIDIHDPQNSLRTSALEPTDLRNVYESRRKVLRFRPNNSALLSWPWKMIQTELIPLSNLERKVIIRNLAVATLLQNDV